MVDLSLYLEKTIKTLIEDCHSLAVQLHALRISKQLSFEQVCQETGIPPYVLDNMELGRGTLNLGSLYVLAKYYGRKVRISLVE